MISQDQWGHILRPWSGDRLLPSLGSELRLWYRVRGRSGFYDELRLAYDLWIAYRCVPVAERCQQTTIGFQICQKISFRATSNHTNDKAIYETECATNLSSLDIQDLRSWDYPNPLSSFCHRAINSRWRLSITSFDLRYTMVPGGKVCSRTKSKFKAAKKSAKFRQGYRYQPLDSLYCCSHLSCHRVIHISPTRPNRRLQIAAFQLLWQHSASMSLTKEARSAIYVPMRIGRELGEV